MDVEPEPEARRSIERANARIEVFATAEEASRAGAVRIAEAIARGPAVLGLATGATPIRLYRCLVDLARERRLSLAGSTTYNLDEYYPIAPEDPRSYRSYMRRHLFEHVDLAANRAHVLDGTVPEHAAERSCRAFDDWIEADGGLDVQLLGIGRNGHIGFNEPTELPADRAAALPTRVVELHPTTIADAAREFDGDAERVPRRALTLGTATILAARSILVLAFGASKAEAVAAAIDGERTGRLPASLLRGAAGPVTWMLDPESARLLRS